MGLKGRSSCVALALVLLAVVRCHGSATGGPALFLTMKSSNFGMVNMDHIKCGFLIVTDILISPDGVPLPFFNDNCVYKKRAGLKIIASFGGSVVPSDLFAFLSCDDNRRAAFVDNLVEFTLAHGFHGIDLSWLYPAPQERDRYVRLLKDLRHACDRCGLLLTVTVPSRPSVIEVNYPVEKLEKYADYVILSTTEFRKLRKTSFIAPLYSSSPGSSNSIDYHVDRWKMAGLSCGKIVVVIQTMTLTYKLYIQNEYRIGTPALQLKIRPYYKICRKLYSGSLEIWDSSAKSPYAFRDLSWYSYENEKSIKEKVCFVVQQGLGGIAVFYFDEDDPINICGDGQYPLTAIVVAALQSEYLPPSVITDSQIYHFDSPSMSSPHSHIGQSNYNSALVDRNPLVFYVEEKNPEKSTYDAHVAKNPTDMYVRPKPPTDIIEQMCGLVGSLSMIENSPSPSRKSQMDLQMDSIEQILIADNSMSDEHIDDLDEFNFFSPEMGQVVEVGDSVDLPAVFSSVKGAPFVRTGSGLEPTTSVQLFSEDVPPPPPGASGPNPLFSEQSNTQRVVYTEPRPEGCSGPRPCKHFPPQPPSACRHKLPGIRIFATAHGPTTTTTTTEAPMQFFTMAPAAYRPPTFCQACKPCVKLLGTGSADAPKVSTPSPCPPTSSASYPLAQLYSELGSSMSAPAAMPFHVNGMRAASSPIAVQFQANAVGAQPITPFAPFGVKVCPCDGILQDPHDRRSYYLCKRGLPMCDENKFTCAHGYFFDEGKKKCVAEGSSK